MVLDSEGFTDGMANQKEPCIEEEMESADEVSMETNDSPAPLSVLKPMVGSHLLSRSAAEARPRSPNGIVQPVQDIFNPYTLLNIHALIAYIKSML